MDCYWQNAVIYVHSCSFLIRTKINMFINYSILHKLSII